MASLGRHPGQPAQFSLSTAATIFCHGSAGARTGCNRCARSWRPGIRPVLSSDAFVAVFDPLDTDRQRDAPPDARGPADRRRSAPDARRGAPGAHDRRRGLASAWRTASARSSRASSPTSRSSTATSMAPHPDEFRHLPDLEDDPRRPSSLVCRLPFLTKQRSSSFRLST